MTSRFEKTLRWIVHNPGQTAAIVVGSVAVSATAYYLFRRLTTESEEKGGFGRSNSVVLAPEERSETLRQLAAAVRESGAVGIRIEDAAAIHRDFLKHAIRGKTGQPVLGPEAFRKVCYSIGLKNRGIVEHLFEVWDKDGNEEIDFVEFMSSIALVRSGSPDEKLGVIFNVMDTDKTGAVTMSNMIHFLDNVYRTAGRPRTMGRIVKDVEAIFASLDKDNSLGLTWDEFKHASYTMRVVTGETLVDLLDVITQQFTEALGATASPELGPLASNNSGLRRTKTTG